MATTDQPAAKSRWWQRVVPAILTAGALAGAVTALISFWPTSPVDVEDKAIFTSGHVVAPQRLSTFVPTSTLEPINGKSMPGPASSPHVGLVAVRLTASAQSDSPAEGVLTAATPSHQVSPAGGDTPTPDGSPTPDDSPASGSPTPLGTASILEIEPDKRDRLLRKILDQHALDGYDLPTLAPAPPPDSPLIAIPLTSTQALGTNGKPLSAKKAAAKFAATLAAGRSVGHKGKRDPVGALVTVNLELDGLRGQPLVLYWRMVRVQGAAVLPKAWRKPAPAYRLKPSTDHDTANLDTWVPMPRAKGPYRVDLILAEEGNGLGLASYSSDKFD